MSEIIGTEYRWGKVDLDKDEIEKRERALAKTYEKQREAQNQFKSFESWASPRARAAEDPDYKNSDLEGEQPVSVPEAQGMYDEVAHQRRQKGARVNALKAERDHLRRTIAQGFEWRRRECDMIADPDKPEIAYVDKLTGEEVDRRAMTSDERQNFLPGTEPSKKKNGKSKSPAAAV